MKLDEMADILLVTDGALRDLLKGIYQVEGMQGLRKDQAIEDDKLKIIHDIGDHIIHISILIENLGKLQNETTKTRAPLMVIDGGRKLASKN